MMWYIVLSLEENIDQFIWLTQWTVTFTKYEQEFSHLVRYVPQYEA